MAAQNQGGIIIPPLIYRRDSLLSKRGIFGALSQDALVREADGVEYAFTARTPASGRYIPCCTHRNAVLLLEEMSLYPSKSQDDFLATCLAAATPDDTRARLARRDFGVGVDFLAYA